jgi:hypothetical protein
VKNTEESTILYRENDSLGGIVDYKIIHETIRPSMDMLDLITYSVLFSSIVIILITVLCDLPVYYSLQFPLSL